MKVKFYGTRGSIPVSGLSTIEYGGNTTSVLIKSDCIPAGMHLVIDTGSGFVPLAYDCLKEQCNTIVVLYTHYHYDHTIGLTLAPVTFIKDIRIIAYGPEEHGIGPSKMMEDLMKPPYFPVDFKEVRSSITGKGIDLPNSRIFVIHPEGGLKLFTINQLEQFEKEDVMLPFSPGAKYPLNECLVIRMHKSNHPERTISYRFEERSTGKVFVFLTDHENQDGKPQNFLGHVRGADLLVMDSQYDRVKYDSKTAGYGHGTPDYCVDVALWAKSRMLGLTHHDPTSDDACINGMLVEAEEACRNKSNGDLSLMIFACRDNQEIEL